MSRDDQRLVDDLTHIVDAIAKISAYTEEHRIRST